MKKTEDGMNYEIHYRPGCGKKGRDYIAITPDCIGGFAFGKTKENALRALKRVHKMTIEREKLKAQGIGGKPNKRRTVHVS